MPHAFDAFEDPVFLFSRKGIYQHCNESARVFMARTGMQESVMANGYDHFLRVLDDVLPRDSDMPHFTRKDRFWDGGIVLQLLSIAADSHLHRLSRALEIMPWGIITVERREEGNVLVFCNERAGFFLQIPPANMIGLKIEDIFRVAGIEGDFSGGETLDKNGHNDYRMNADERVRWLRVHTIPTKDTVPSTYIVIEDTTDAKVMEGQYSQSQRLESLGQLAGGVAHDFNNLLSIIDGYARVTKKAVTGNQQAVNYLDHIGKAVERGAALTSRLLTFGRHKVAKDTVLDLGQLVKEQEPLLRPLMDASIALSINAQDLTPVEITPDALCQILLNLCINARDAMPDGGTLIIDCLRDQKTGRAKLQVIDSGFGMTPDIQAKIFDPFFTTKGQGKGTGLGLSMVYGLITDMNGSIDVESKPGSGTVFTLWIPLSESMSMEHKTEEFNSCENLDGLTVLVAEDEPDLLNLVCGMIEGMGARVLRASNGNQALQVQEGYEGQIDFLLTDVVMPEMNGVRLAEIFHLCRPAAKTLFMSGYPATGQMARIALPEGALLMPKPVNFERLSTVVRIMAGGNDDKAAMEQVRAIAGQWKITP